MLLPPVVVECIRSLMSEGKIEHRSGMIAAQKLRQLDPKKAIPFKELKASALVGLPPHIQQKIFDCCNRPASGTTATATSGTGRR